MKVYIVYVFLTHLFLGFRTKISVLTAHILNLYVHSCVPAICPYVQYIYRIVIINLFFQQYISYILMCSIDLMSGFFMCGMFCCCM